MKKKPVIKQGIQFVTREVLESVPIPNATGTFQPISHSLIADMILEIGENSLIGCSFKEEQFLISRFGQQVIGFLIFDFGNNSEKLCIAYRNSYDKSISLGICAGVYNYDWDSFAFKGKVIFMKHTYNLLFSVNERLIVSVYHAIRRFSELVEDLRRFKYLKLNDNDAFKLFGLLYGNNLLSPRQFSNAVNCWKDLAKDSKVDLSLYNFYAVCSRAIKNTQALIFLDNYTGLHSKLTEVLGQ